MKIWGRIGGLNQMPPELPKPIITPNVEIVGKLPTNAKVRTTYYYNESDFAFTPTNNESFPFPIYWHIETDSNPGTQINFSTYPTEGQMSIPAKGTNTQTAKYWFNTAGNYDWKYVAEYPKGNPVTSWTGTLNVAPFPDVKIQSVTLPSNVKVSSGFLVTNYNTVFRLANNESVDVTVNWQANSSVTGNFDSGSVTVPKNGYVDVTKAYHYTNAGPVRITYTIYYNGVQIDTKSSTMNVAP